MLPLIVMMAARTMGRFCVQLFGSGTDLNLIPFRFWGAVSSLRVGVGLNLSWLSSGGGNG